MNKIWKKRLLRIFGVIAVLIVTIAIIKPLPKFIRYQINKSVSDLEVEGKFIKNIENVKVEGIPVRVYNSDATLKPVIFYIPGGAFIAGNLETHDNISRYLASELNAVVVSIDYRKAPENKYPKGLQDSERVLNWIYENFNELNTRPKKPLLIGDSGGANFCAVLTKKHRDSIAGQVLINPALDLTESGPAYQNWAMFVEWYLDDLSESKNENVSPLLSDSFLGLPPTIIITCEKDPLKKDGKLYKEKLERDNVQVILKNYEDFGHLANLWAGTSSDTEMIRKFVVEEIEKTVLNNGY